MKSKIKINSGNGIGFGASIGLALGYAIGRNSSNPMQFIAMCLTTGIVIGAIIDFLNRPK